jgi:DNA-binding transcriptional regulator YiaG
MTAEDLRAWRLRLGLSEVQAARAMNKPVQTYRNWEDERRRVDPMAEPLTRYIERFGPLDE